MKELFIKEWIGLREITRVVKEPRTDNSKSHLLSLPSLKRLGEQVFSEASLVRAMAVGPGLPAGAMTLGRGMPTQPDKDPRT